MDKLETMIDLAYQHACRVLIGNKKQLTSTFALATDEKVTICGCAWRDDFEREAIIDNIRVRIKKLGIKRYSFVAEAWTYVTEEGKPIVRAWQAPNKREIVVAVAADASCKICRTWSIERDWKGNCINLKQQPDVDGMSMVSWISELLPQHDSNTKIH